MTVFVIEESMVYKIIQRPNVEEKCLVGPVNFEVIEGEGNVSYTFDLEVGEHVERRRRLKNNV